MDNTPQVQPQDPPAIDPTLNLESGPDTGANAAQVNSPGELAALGVLFLAVSFIALGAFASLIL
ncbi:hypothetical protein [Fodinicurvata fenggangensis]|uniref:hypothetical protein n=1 Tax=Fodinicurvata fenggangensis TaxID=1121830 RepID=UPI00047C06FA|nr:hypothetical protein [Fodinicurvata fenggangensis]